MNITATALSLNVADVAASVEFAETHLGFVREMEAEGFASLGRDDAGSNLIFLQAGLSTFKPAAIAGHHADGLLIVFVLDDVDAFYDELTGRDIPITTPIETEPWGERYFQITDPNGVVYQFVQWIESPIDGGNDAVHSARSERPAGTRRL